MPKGMKTLAAVLVFLAAAYGILLIPRPEGPSPLPAAPAVIDRFSVSRASHTVTLRQSDAGWRLTPEDFPAEENAVTYFLEGLRNLRAEHLLSRRPESAALYDLTDDRALRVAVWAPGAAAPVEWLLGKASPDGNQLYLRRPGQNEIYLATGLLRDGVKENTDDWRDPRLWPAPPEDPVVALRVERRKDSFTLEKGSAGWTVNGRPADDAAAERCVNEFRALAGDAFVPPGPRGVPDQTVTGRLSSGKSETWRVSKPDSASPPRLTVERAGVATLYRLNADRFTLDRVRAKDLLKTAN